MNDALKTELLAAYDGQVVSAAWAVYKKGTEFTGLWGGCPILQRLGFVAVTTTTPYVYKPA